MKTKLTKIPQPSKNGGESHDLSNRASPTSPADFNKIDVKPKNGNEL